MDKYLIKFNTQDTLKSYYFAKQELAQALLELSTEIDIKISRLNDNLKIPNISLFYSLKNTLIKYLSAQETKLNKRIEKWACIQEDKDTLQNFLECLRLQLRKSCPPLKEESNVDQNISLEKQLLEAQKGLSTNKDFLDMLKNIKTQARERQLYKKIYFICASTEPSYKKREGWVEDDFLPVLAQHFKKAGIEVIWEKDLVNGGNLYQFMSQILDQADYIIIFGTLSLRDKSMQDSIEMQYQQSLLNYRWRNGVVERNINPNTTTFIPFILTGICETALPEDFITHFFPSKQVKAWRELNYEKQLLELLSQIYGVSKIYNWLKATIDSKSNSLRLSDHSGTLFSIKNNSEKVTKSGQSTLTTANNTSPKC